MARRGDGSEGMSSISRKRGPVCGKRMRHKARLRAGVAPLTAALAAGLALPAAAETLRPADWGSLNLYGAPGLLDMPSGKALPDGEFAVDAGRFGNSTRVTLGFQFLPWLSGNFRYVALSNWNYGGFDTYYDRNFDVRFRLHEETTYWPEITLGLQDFAGTGLYSGEFLAATKEVLPGLRVTGGLGWGRFAGRGAIGSFGTRPTDTADTGGQFNADMWFRGDVAPFGGLEWHPTERLGLKLEYSSDIYKMETERGVIDQRSPINIGAEWQATDSIRLGANYMYGTDFGFNVAIVLNPKRPPTNNTMEGGPVPVKPRPSPAAQPEAWSTGWVTQPGRDDRIGANLNKLLAVDGMGVEALELSGDRAVLYLRNNRYPNTPQSVVRAARTMTQVMPASVETFDIVSVTRGVPVSRVTLRRSDLEALEFAPDNAAALRARVAFSAAPGGLPLDDALAEDRYPAFRWSLGPYLRMSLFDPNEPLRAELGLRLGADYDLAPGWTISGSVSKRVVGNLHYGRRNSNSTLPHVRSDSALYDEHGDPGIDRFQIANVRHPFGDIYTRLTIGYLERMYGGVSGEVLWSPVDSPLALGAELNWVKQRDFDLMFGFRDYEVTMGHVSAYYDFGGGYRAQLDVGRYLAGDWGATLSVDREFANGWRVGAFATKTDVSAEEFGEGSFDKGIRLTIPFSWILGQPTLTDYNAVIRPLTRDGGAQLNVSGRLYETVRPYQQERLDMQWGKAWR